MNNVNHTIAIALCWFINALDGFDVLAIAFAAPAISGDWAIERKALGLVLSAGIAGMVLGSLLLAPLADRFGRRPVVFVGLSVTGIAMLATTTAQSVQELVLWRAITGVGIGGQLAAVTALVTEYAPTPRRKRIMGWFHTGYPIGAISAGIVAAVLIPKLGWQCIFLIGGGLSLLVIPLALFGLPESMQFLNERRPGDALARINQVQRRLGLREWDELPDLSGAIVEKPGPSALLTPALRSNTLLLWSAFFCALLVVYFLQSWTPQLVAEAAGDKAIGVRAGIALNVGGIAGVIIMGLFSERRGLRRLAVVLMLTGTALMAAFTQLPPSGVLLLITCFVMGTVVFGGYIGIYFAAALVYPAALRSSGVGWAVGLGRIGAVLGPWLAGVIGTMGYPAVKVYPLFALPLALAALTFAGISARTLQPGGDSMV